MTKAILVIGFGGKGVGDQIVATPFIRNLALNFPDSAIDFAASSVMGIELLKYDPYLRDVFVLDMSCFRLGGEKGFAEKLAYIKLLRKKKYQRVYILSTKLRHAMVAFAVSSGERIGFASYHREFLLTKYWQEPLQKNLVDRFLDLLVLDGLKVVNNRIEVFLQKAEADAAQQRLSGLFPDGRPVVALAPFAADMRRTWGLQRFAELAGRCSAEGWGVVLLGSAADRDKLTATFCTSQAGVADLVGAQSIRETAALISITAAFTGNDSGLAHLAGAVSTSGVVIGYHVTKVWYPAATCIQTIIRDPDCSDCDLARCTGDDNRTPPCFEAVTVDEVFNRLKIIITEVNK